jgi:hypothetical protein
VAIGGIAPATVGAGSRAEDTDSGAGDLQAVVLPHTVAGGLRALILAAHTFEMVHLADLEAIA